MKAYTLKPLDWIRNKTGELLAESPLGWFIVMQSDDGEFYWSHGGKFHKWYDLESDAVRDAENHYRELMEQALYWVVMDEIVDALRDTISTHAAMNDLSHVAEQDRGKYPPTGHVPIVFGKSTVDGWHAALHIAEQFTLETGK